jgi:hypothetical protein
MFVVNVVALPTDCTVAAFPIDVLSTHSDFDGAAAVGVVAQSAFPRALTLGLVDGGIVSSGSRGMLRRCCARRISPCLTFHDFAASRRPC